MSSLIEEFAASSQLAGGNAAFVEGLYESWLADPNSVDANWRTYFDSLKGRGTDVPHGPVIEQVARDAKNGHRFAAAAKSSAPSDSGYAEKQAAVLKLVTAYRSRGHLAAKLDPLELTKNLPAPDLDLPFHGLSNADLDTEFATASTAGSKRMKLKDLLAQLQRTYSGAIGAEFMHISDSEQRRWLYDRLEGTAGEYALTNDDRKRILHKLTQAEGLERYLHTKYVGQKRFSLEGGDSLIPLMDEVIRRAGTSGMRECIIGMAHRGRLNVLVNTLGKPPGTLFAEFEGKHEGPEDPAHSGDVKYHMGYSSDIQTPGGPIHLALGFNPSHLEIIDPVVTGSVRARQTRRRDTEMAQVMPILIHGDAAFAGQGVVMELFQMSQARGFKVGGTVHIVVNNQVGFTTSRADDARSTLYATDPAKIIGAPVLHVNGEDPDAVQFCARLAFDYRQQFKRDVVIDLVCYRRHGHNEADEPAATQPLMYQVIRARKTVRELYADKLASQDVIAADEAKAMADAYRAALEKGDSVAELASNRNELTPIDWNKHLDATFEDAFDTAVPKNDLDALAQKIVALPNGLTLHPRVAKVYEDRAKMARGELAMDWGYTENLAYASLVAQGFKLRVVGQDSGRGTFFHRHAVLHDQKTGEAYTPLKTLSDDPTAVTIIDSLLSEEAVMAFEYGYSTTDPSTLVIWEGQFGDFANGAQVVIDQFISSGEAKWGRLSGLTLFLPHGYEGQGPEHSSARLERFLQLCALNNMQVVAPTTPAQWFHLIRRQMVRNLRKPLVVMTPKSMLRHKLSTSTIDELASGGFREMIPDVTAKDPKKVKRVVLCSGKVYYDLAEGIESRKVSDVAIVRIEQLFPFPRVAVREEIARFTAAKSVVWCQEEPQNQGAWYQIQHHIQACLGDRQKLYYAGRPRSPAPAVGHYNTHVVEQNALVEAALTAKLNGDIGDE